MLPTAPLRPPAGLAVDSAGYFYMTGETLSAGFPITSNAYDPTFTMSGQNDAFLIRIFDRPGNQTTPASLIYGTFFGGDNHVGGTSQESGNRGRSLSFVELAGHPFDGLAMFSGMTTTDDFPTTLGALIRDWLSGDIRTGVLSVHDTSP